MLTIIGRSLIIDGFNMDLKKLNLLFFKNINNKYKYDYNVLYNLKKQFGIGFGKVTRVVNHLGINKKTQLKYCNKFITLNLNFFFKNYYQINSMTLLQYLRLRIIRHVNIKDIRGFKHEHNLPVRGQRTHTNSRTQKHLKRHSALLRLDLNRDKKNIQKQSIRSPKKK